MPYKVGNKREMGTGAVYKLMIVDDEYNIRIGISEGIEWKDYDIKVVVTAENPHEALEKARQEEPDIGIIDIELSSDMNGLDLIEKLKQEHPQMQFIILSGYDRFSFAQRAISLSICQYLLKPVLADELIEAVEQVKKNIASHRDKVKEVSYLHNRRCVRSIIDQVTGDHEWNPAKVAEQLDAIGAEYAQCSTAVVLISLDEIHADAVVVLTRYVTAVENGAIRQGVRPGVIIAPISGSRKIACIFLARYAQMRGKMEAVLIDSRREIIQNFSLQCSLGFSTWHSGIDQLRQAFHEAQDAVDYRFLSSRSGVYYASDISYSGSNAWNFQESAAEKLLERMAARDEKQLSQEIDSLFAQIAEQNMSRKSITAVVNDIFFVMSKKLLELDRNADVYIETLFDGLSTMLSHCSYLSEVKSWLCEHIVELMEQCFETQKDTEKSLISEVKDYIKTNYPDPDLSLANIAAHFYITSEYLSTLFKEKTGQRFIDYLIEYRIEKAKALLENGNMRVHEVGERVGYCNNQYFCTIFKRMTGTSPREYRKQSRGGKA